MSVLNSSTDIGFLINNIGNYVLGSNELVGIWLLLLFMFLGLSLNIDFEILIIIMLPLIIVLTATGFIFKPIGGFLILAIGFFIAKNFFFK